jgi:hypothetical protein
MAKQKVEMVNIEYGWEADGVEENDTDDDHKNPVYRAFRHLLLKGKDIHQMASLIFKDTFSEPGKTVYRWIGIFVLTEGNRICFFPGEDDGHSMVDISFNERHSKTRKFQIDHITLDSDLESVHITEDLTGIKSKKNYEKGYTTIKLDSEISLWFSITIQKLSAFRKVSKFTALKGVTPKTDAKRRDIIWTKISSNCHRQTIIVNEEVAKHFPNNGVWHLEFFIAERGFKDYTRHQGRQIVQGPLIQLSKNIDVENLGSGKMQSANLEIDNSRNIDIVYKLIRLPFFLPKTSFIYSFSNNSSRRDFR